jgi:hypothetical protein
MNKQLTLPGSGARRITQPEPVALIEGTIIQVWIPGIKLQSLNQTFRGASRGARMAAAAKTKAQRQAVTLVLDATTRNRPLLPLIATITRVAPGRGLDPHDNLPGACKHIVDGVAAWLGIDDRHPQIVWRYEQRSDGRTVGVGIRLEAG